MKKWMWITVPALAVGLGLVFLGGSVFAQNAGNNTTPTVNWTAMADYCRSIFTGNTTVADSNVSGMRSYCQNATAAGNFEAGGMMDNGGMMGGYTGNGTYAPGGMMGNGGMMGW